MKKHPTFDAGDSLCEDSYYVMFGSTDGDVSLRDSERVLRLSNGPLVYTKGCDEQRLYIMLPILSNNKRDEYRVL